MNKSVKCRLKDKNTGLIHDYNSPIYTKLYGVYGYVTVSFNEVYFYYTQLHDGDVHFDILTNYEIIY